MRLRNLLGALLFCLGFLVYVQPATADTVDGVTFSLVNANLTGSASNTFTWDYNVSNASGVQILGLFVNAGLFTGGTPNALAFDGFGAAGTINNGSSRQGVLFSFSPNPLAPSSFNSGQFDLTVLLANANGTIIDLFANYSATVSPANNVAEPSSLMLLASGLLAGLLALRRASN